MADGSEGQKKVNLQQTIGLGTGVALIVGGILGKCVCVGSGIFACLYVLMNVFVWGSKTLVCSLGLLFCLLALLETSKIILKINALR